MIGSTACACEGQRCWLECKGDRLVNGVFSSSEERVDPQGCLLTLWYGSISICAGMNPRLSCDLCGPRAAGQTCLVGNGSPVHWRMVCGFKARLYYIR